MKEKNGLGTIPAIHTGTVKNLYGTLAVPIYQSSHLFLIQQNRVEEDLLLKKGDIFILDFGNPTTTVLESKIAAMEEGEAGIAMSSGMGADFIYTLDTFKSRRSCNNR